MPGRVLAFALPFLSLFWTDLILGFHSTMIYVYASVALSTIIGFFLQEKWGASSFGKSEEPKAFKSFASTFAFPLAGASLLGSTLFFLITNFGVWFSQDMYEKSFNGLLQCYGMAIPFFGQQVVGDLFYAGFLFGVFEGVKFFIPSMKTSTAYSSF